MIYVIIAFGILVFIHEFGHFLIAKLFKVKVEKFSIGLGPAIVSFFWKGTKFQIGAIPLGGFCQFKDDGKIEDLPVILTKDQYDYLKKELQKINKAGQLNIFYKVVLPESLNKDDIDKIEDSYEKECLLNCYNENFVLKEKIIDKDLLPAIELLESHNLYERRYKLIYEEPEKKNNDDYYDDDEVIENNKISIKEDFTRTIYKYIDVFKIRDKDTFFGIRPFKRLLIAFSGPFFNYLLAIIFLAFTFLINIKEVYIPNKIVLVDDIRKSDGEQKDVETSAKMAGLKTGDKIIKINNHKIETYQDIYEEMILSSGKKSITVTVEREGKTLDFIVYPRWNKDLLKPELGVFYYQDPVIGDEGLLEKAIGLKKNDKIVEIVDSGITDYNGIIINNFIYENINNDKNWKIIINRENNNIELSANFYEIHKKLTIENVNNKIIKNKKEEDFIYLNFLFPVKENKKISFLEALYNGFYQSNRIVRLTYTGFISLIFRPKGNVKNVLGGPIKIGYIVAKVTDESMKKNFMEGVKNFLLIMSNISLALAVFNLIPFPALDGSYILISIIELVTKRAFRIKYIFWLNLIGFAFLLSLAIIVGYFDIVSIIK